MSTKFTAQHFPKGTIISTSLYTTNEEGLADIELNRDLEDVFDTTSDSATRSESDLIDELDTNPSYYSDDAHYPY